MCETFCEPGWIKRAWQIILIFKEHLGSYRTHFWSQSKFIYIKIDVFIMSYSIRGITIINTTIYKCKNYLKTLVYLEGSQPLLGFLFWILRSPRFALWRRRPEILLPLFIILLALLFLLQLLLLLLLLPLFLPLLHILSIFAPC